MFHLSQPVHIVSHFPNLTNKQLNTKRSFNRLIKSYLRSTMTEERLSRLALLSIEKKFTTKLNYDKVMDYVAKMMPRRKKLL